MAHQNPSNRRRLVLAKGKTGLLAISFFHLDFIFIVKFVFILFALQGIYAKGFENKD
jgi:hypothetical protein